MKLECEVTRVSNTGESVNITLAGRQKNDADWRRDGEQTIQVTCTDKVKRAFWLGRRVVITVDPR